MKELIKLRDMTIEQWDNYKNNKCNYRCNDCAFYGAECLLSCNIRSWIHNKNIYSDEFLERKIIIETSNVLDKVEKEYLTNVIKPFKNRVVSISKKVVNFSHKENKIFYYIRITIKDITETFDEEFMSFPYFKSEMYKGMENCKEYTLEDLGL